MITNSTTFGYPEIVWAEAKEEAKEILRRIARKKATISYSDLTNEISAIKFEPHGKPFFHFLGEISLDEESAGRGMMTAIVVHKHGDLKPGPGFYDLAQSLGKDVKDLDSTWIGEVNEVYRAWAR